MNIQLDLPRMNRALPLSHFCDQIAMRYGCSLHLQSYVNEEERMLGTSLVLSRGGRGLIGEQFGLHFDVIDGISEDEWKELCEAFSDWASVSSRRLCFDFAAYFESNLWC